MKKEFLEFENLKYIVRYPENYESGNCYPVILHLHGAGGRGTDLNVLLSNPYFEITDRYEDFEFITVAPLCHSNTWFDIFETLKRFAQKVANEEFTDRNRFYLVGASMGAYAAWQLGMSYPELFAAMVPICGGGMYWNAGRLKDVPIWALHGQKDETVYAEESIKMVDAVNKAGGNAQLTIYPENTHDAWSDTYRNREVFEWLLTKKKGNN